MADSRGSHRTDGGLRVSRGAASQQQWRRQERVGGQAFSRSGHWRIVSILRAGQGNQRRRRAGQDQRGWRERRRGSLISCSVSQSIRSSSISSSPKCIISSLSAAVQAFSLMVGTVAGSRTWSDGLSSTSEANLCSVTWLCAGLWIAVGNAMLYH